MKSLYTRGLIVAAVFSLLLTSCGGGGGGGGSAGGGIDGTGIMSAGVVTAFGSVVVNGTEFDTRGAAVVINGQEVGVGDDFVLSNLKIGMVVTVEGWIKADGNAVADRVLYRSNVVGPVESISIIDPTTKEIVVLGQTVIVNVVTRFAETSFDGIATDDVVQVSGYFDDNGAVRATFLEKIGDITTILEYEVTGFVESLDTDFYTFVINGLTVDYFLIRNDLPEGIPAERLFVEIEGELGAGGKLIAAKIELGDVLDGDDGDDLEIMGYVTVIISDNDIIKFKIGNQEVHAQADPELVVYVDGSPDDIVPGQKLEAEGSFEGGILVAHEIEFWKPDQVEVEGVVTNIISTTDFYIGLQHVQTNPGTTAFDGGSPDDLALGVRLEAKGVPVDLNQSVIMADKVSFETD